MTRLEFVSMSLSKGLKGVISIDGEQEIVTLKSIDTDGNEIWVSSDNWVYSSLNYDINIICRHFSGLTKEIDHKNKIFVPIIELAKIAFNNNYTTRPESKVAEEVFFNNGVHAILGYTEENRVYLMFSHLFNNRGFEFKVDGEIKNVDQLYMFQKLIEWKFNLMDENEPFIDVNTLDVNPYK